MSHTNSDLEVVNVGIRWYHPPGFCVNRPAGSGDFAFMQWLTPITIRIDGVVHSHAANGCIVFRPADPQWFGGDQFTPFGNSWFHFRGVEAEAILHECGIPTNRVMYLRDDRFVEPLLSHFQRENMNRSVLWRMMTRSYVWRFFIETARALRKDSLRLGMTRGMGRRQDFELLRERMRAECGRAWTVSDMAEAVHLSSSRFTRLYRQFFECNPVDDLIGMRVGLAEYYLRMSDMPVGEIAQACGFADTHYFSRLFKKRLGESPASYRLLNGGGGEA
ncbi:MAG: AraC family transcriptional regulator [Planctomycetaceae bacterium]|nr:AraC family transcriptional regulator [Planctomycetaceae bacterium]